MSASQVSWVGDHCLVPMVGTILLGLTQPPWPNLGLMLWDQGPVNRRKKELVMLMWGFQDINW